MTIEEAAYDELIDESTDPPLLKLPRGKIIPLPKETTIITTVAPIENPSTPPVTILPPEDTDTPPVSPVESTIRQTPEIRKITLIPTIATALTPAPTMRRRSTIWSWRPGQNADKDTGSNSDTNIEPHTDKEKQVTEGNIYIPLTSARLPTIPVPPTDEGEVATEPAGLSNNENIHPETSTNTNTEKAESDFTDSTDDVSQDGNDGFTPQTGERVTSSDEEDAHLSRIRAGGSKNKSGNTGRCHAKSMVSDDSMINVLHSWYLVGSFCIILHHRMETVPCKNFEKTMNTNLLLLYILATSSDSFIVGMLLLAVVVAIVVGVVVWRCSKRDSKVDPNVVPLYVKEKKTEHNRTFSSR